MFYVSITGMGICPVTQGSTFNRFLAGMFPKFLVRVSRGLWAGESPAFRTLFADLSGEGVGQIRLAIRPFPHRVAAARRRKTPNFPTASWLRRLNASPRAAGPPSTPSVPEQLRLLQLTLESAG